MRNAPTVLVLALSACATFQQNRADADSEGMRLSQAAQNEPGCFAGSGGMVCPSTGRALQPSAADAAVAQSGSSRCQPGMRDIQCGPPDEVDRSAVAEDVPPDDD